ncbi:MAG: TolC family protein, partial [Chlamydiota bacterium]
QMLSLDLIARRPDLAAQKARVESAAKEIGAAKTDFYPNINLMGVVGLESLFWSTLFQQKNYSSSLEPALHLPIFTAGRLRAQLMEKVAVFNEAVYTYDELILQATQEIADNLTAMARIQKEIELRTRSLTVAQTKAKLNWRRFQNAIEDRIGFLNAKNQVLNEELILIQLEYGKQLASIQLIRSLGGGYLE